VRTALSLVLGVLGVLLVAGFGGRAHDLDEVRICGAADFDRDSAACKRDRRAGISSGTIYCSAHTSGHEGDTFTGRLSYRGAAFPLQKGRIGHDNGNAYTFLTIGGGAFPGGAWRCDLAAGDETASVTFTTRGPSGPVTSLAACLTKNTVLAGPVRSCKRDTPTLPATAEVTCSAVYGLAKGRRASVEVLYAGKPTGLRLARKVPLAVSVFGVQVSKPGGMPAGRYACVFSLDGKKVATKTFRIAG
jgi:hypothetical protein